MIKNQLKASSSVNRSNAVVDVEEVKSHKAAAVVDEGQIVQKSEDDAVGNDGKFKGSPEKKQNGMRYLLLL